MTRDGKQAKIFMSMIDHLATVAAGASTLALGTAAIVSAFVF